MIKRPHIKIKRVVVDFSFDYKKKDKDDIVKDQKGPRDPSYFSSNFINT